MKSIFLSVAVLIAASFMFTSCGAPAANNANTGNKAANTGSAPAADKAAVEGEIKKTLDEFAAALNKGDAAALDKFYSDDYTLIDQNGAVQTKAARIEGIKSGKVKMEGLKFDDLKIKTNAAGDGAAITGHVTGKTTIDGKTEDSNSMVTWVMGKSKDKGWVFVNAQITNIKASAAPAKADDKKVEEKKPEGKPAAPANK